MLYLLVLQPLPMNNPFLCPTHLNLTPDWASPTPIWRVPNLQESTYIKHPNDTNQGSYRIFPKEKHASTIVDIMWILPPVGWTTDHGTMELQKWSFSKFGKLMCSRIQASFQWPTVPTIGVAFQYFLISHLTSTSWVSLCMPAIKISSLQTSPVSNNRFMLCFSSYWMQPWTDKQNKIGRFCCF